MKIRKVQFAYPKKINVFRKYGDRLMNHSESTHLLFYSFYPNINYSCSGTLGGFVFLDKLGRKPIGYYYLKMMLSIVNREFYYAHN